MSAPHAGRRAPVRRRVGTTAQSRRERQERRDADVAAVVRTLPPGPVSHEAVADRTGLPVGFVRWAWPDLRPLAGPPVP